MENHLVMMYMLRNNESPNSLMFFSIAVVYFFVFVL